MHAKRGWWLPLLMTLGACEKPVVTWEDSTRLPGSDAVLTTDGLFVADSLARIAGRLTLPWPACPGSVRITRAGAVIDATYWAPGEDGHARLEFARSVDDGATWPVHAVVDSTDVARSGCDRTPPAIAADAASGYIHVSYSMQAKEGAGVFFAHSMDNGALFHSPVAIMYGERLGRTSIASAGSDVAVAFEDPNSNRPRIALAISRTMGHIFEYRLMDISGTEGIATEPMVALPAGRIRIAWREGGEAGAPPAIRVRTGSLH